MPTWQLSPISDDAEPPNPELLTQAVNNEWCNPEFSTSSSATTNCFPALPSEESAQAEPPKLACSSEIISRAESSRNSKIKIRPCKKTIDQEEIAGTTGRSKRARNAANQRHHQYKNGNTVNAEMNHVKKKRESNRVAAAKCRVKQRQAKDDLHERYRELCRANKTMKLELRELREQFVLWRTLALQHTDCQCNALQKYNITQALRASFAFYQDSDVGSVSPESATQSRILSSQLPFFNYSEDVRSNYCGIV